MVWYLYGTAVWGKTFASVENVLRRRVLGRTKILDQGVFYRGGGRGHLYGPLSRQKHKRTQRDGKTWPDSTRPLGTQALQIPGPFCYTSIMELGIFFWGGGGLENCRCSLPHMMTTHSQPSHSSKGFQSKTTNCDIIIPCLRACLHGGRGLQVGEVTRLSIQSLILIWSSLHGRWDDHMRYCMDRRVTSPTWGPPPPRKQALKFKTLKPVPYLAAFQRHITRLGQIRECPVAWWERHVSATRYDRHSRGIDQTQRQQTQSLIIL